MVAINKALGQVIIASSILLSSAGFSQGSSDFSHVKNKVYAENKDTDNKNVKYMNSLAAKNGGRFLIDLSDKKQYEFLVNRMNNIGKTPSNSPKLCSVLNSVKQRHEKLRVSRTGEFGRNFLANVESGNQIDVANHNATILAETLESVPVQEFDPFHILSSHAVKRKESGESVVHHKSVTVLQQEQDYVLIDIAAWTPDWEQVGPSGLSELFRGEGTELVGRASIDLKVLETALAKGGHDHFIVDSVRTITKQSGAARTMSIAAAEPLTEMEYISTQYSSEVLHRTVDTLGVTGAQTAKNGFHIDAPRDLNGDGVIFICTNRNRNECDYQQDEFVNTHPANNDKTLLHIPFRGAVKLPFEVTKIFETDEDIKNDTIHHDTNIHIFRQDNGSKISLLESADGKKFSDYLDMRVTNNTNTGQKETLISWNIPRRLASFGSVIQVENYTKLNWALSIVIQYKKAGGRPRPVTTSLVVDSYKSSDDELFHEKHSPLEVAWGCIAEGTLITLSNGAQLPIEQVQAGDWVLTGNGEKMMVLEQTTGFEEKPMYQIQTADNQSVLVTETHPVATASGNLVWGSEVKVGDMLNTQNGQSEVVSVSEEPYSGKVFNLKLGLPNAAGEMVYPFSDKTFFAGGVEVGDIVAQQKYAHKEEIKGNPAQVLQSLKGTGWEQDYKHARGLK